MSDAERDAFGLRAGATVADYSYTAASAQTPAANLLAIRDKDAAGWRDTQRLLSALGVSNLEAAEITKLLSAILTIGNVTFENTPDDKARVTSTPTVALAARLLGLEPEALERGLLTKLIVSGRGSAYKVPYDALGAADVRDALAKQLYLHFFEWLVLRLNEYMADLGSLPPPMHASGEVRHKRNSIVAASDPTASRAAARRVQRDASYSIHERFVGLLDIFGFEKFDVNSLEQVCDLPVSPRPHPAHDSFCAPPIAMAARALLSPSNAFPPALATGPRVD